MWISKKDYNDLVAQTDNYEKIASETILLNGRVIDSNARLLEEIEDVQKLNLRLQEHNEELVACCKELEAKLSLAIKQRDYYYDLLENTSDAYEEGKAISREAE